MTHQIEVMTPAGDEAFEFDPGDVVEVNEARKRFADLKAKGFTLYEGESQTVITKGAPADEFDPQVAAYVAVPRMARGPYSQCVPRS